MADPLAETAYSCGRCCLKVAGIVLAMQGDPCRDGSLPESVLPPIHANELDQATIGGQSVKDMPIEIVRFFRGDRWTPAMLEYVATKINSTPTP